MVKSIIIILAIVAVVGIFAVIWIFKKSGHLNVNSAQNEIKISRKDAHSIMDLLEALDELNGSD